MWMAEVDENGYVVKVGIRDTDKNTYPLYGYKHRLVVDPIPLPTEFNIRLKVPVKVEPVIGDTIEYKFEDRPMAPLSPEEQEVMNSSLQKAKEFLESKGIDSSQLYYFVTIYDASKQQDVAMAFTSGMYGSNDNVKVSLLTNSVTEWYQVGSFTIDGVEYNGGVSKDLVTGEIIDKYRITGNNIQEKVTPDGKIVMTYPYEVKPTDPIQAKILSDFGYREIGDDFKYRDHITGWSNKENGFIIQYDRLVKQR